VKKNERKNTTMAKYMSLLLDGEGLRQFDAPGIDGGWRCLEVELGDETFFVDIKKTTPGTHTAPAEAEVMPTHDECAEVIGRMFVAVSGRQRRRVVRNGGEK
jgi:hypothetical protein